MDTVIFKVFRFNPLEPEKRFFQTYEIPVEPGMTVLSGLLYIQNFIDGSLAFRYSCRAGVCGSCAMHINGVYRLACETQVKLLKSRTIEIRPLSHLPLLKDLIVDMTIFWEKYKAIKPYLIAGSPIPPDGRERIQSPDEREKITGLIDCILCGACYSACTVTGTNPDYLGPAALTKAARFYLDSRDNAKDIRLNIVRDEDGVFRCHTIYNCQRVCPKDIDPAGAISILKMAVLKSR